MTLFGFLAVISLMAIRMNLLVQMTPELEPGNEPMLRDEKKVLGHAITHEACQASFRQGLPEWVVDCHAFLQGPRNGTIQDPNKGQLLSRFTAGYPQFWVSVHVEEVDPVRYLMLKKGSYYESILSQSFTEILGKNKDGHVIDVGGNIGWFSLLSRAMGHTVDMFEPHPANILRVCESTLLNGWEDCSTVHPALDGLNPNKGYIHVHPIGLLHESKTLFLDSWGLSPGQGRLSDKASRPESIHVPVSTLDAMAEKLGWLEKDIAILKVDVEGYEYNVFRGARQLIHSRRVRNIFLEVKLHKSKIPNFVAISSFLVSEGYVAHKIGGHKGPSQIYEPPPGANYTSALYEACASIERKAPHCNMWWKRN